jgi:hypothetical protein
MATQLISAITRILGEIPTNSALRQRVELLKDQAAALERRVKDLEQDNAQLRSRVKEFEESDADRAVSFDFVEHRGALFKRKPGGGYERAVYCPKCQVSTSSLEKMLPYHCGACRWCADFTGRELDEVLKELPKS